MTASRIEARREPAGEYHLRVTAAREAGHRTNGDGTAVDLIPAGSATQALWDASAGRLAHDLGWTLACGPSGTRPACRLAPAIRFIGYDRYSGHGSPRTCAGSCPAHLHLSWASPCYGTSSLASPCEYVAAVPHLSDAAACFAGGKRARLRWRAGRPRVVQSDCTTGARPRYRSCRFYVKRLMC